MHILFLTQVFPYPLDAGPKVRAYYVLRYLAERGHRITLLSFVRPADEEESIAHLRTFCDEVITVPMPRSHVRDALALARSLFTGQPFLITRDHVSTMAATVQRLLQTQDFDAVHADQLWMAPYALLARTSNPAPHLILDQHNAVFQIPRRLAETTTNPLARHLLAREARIMARYERDIIRQFHRVVWVTEEDQRAVTGAQPASDEPPSPFRPFAPSPHRHSVIPICVDPEQKRPVARENTPRRVTFLGGLHWPPNAAGVVWFAQEVWPLVAREVPDARLTIIGKNPPRALTQSPAANIDITGYVADLAPYLQETAVFIVPLHAGGGMRVKILDAWAWGLPVVSTTIGAEGLAAQPGENLLLADDAQGFARAVVAVLQQPALGERLARAGRETVERAYDWRKVYRAWDQVYDFAAKEAGTKL